MIIYLPLFLKSGHDLKTIIISNADTCICTFACFFFRFKVIHFCQRYEVDKYFYAKRKVPHDIFTCDFPLLVEPPMNLGSGKYLSFVPNGRPESERKEMSPEKEKMQGFVRTKS